GARSRRGGRAAVRDRPRRAGSGRWSWASSRVAALRFWHLMPPCLRRLVAFVRARPPRPSSVPHRSAMPAPRDTAVVVRTARLYYEQGRSQTEIAQELGLSRSNVSRVLTQARDRGIVEITIHDPEGPPRRDEALEAALRAAFSLREAHVVYAPRTPAMEAVAREAHVVSAPRTPAMEAVAREGAAVLTQRLATVRSIGVSWGQTVQRVVAQLE